MWTSHVLLSLYYCHSCKCSVCIADLGQLHALHKAAPQVLRGWCYRAHIQHEFNKLRSSNSVSVRVKSAGDWWEADPESKLFRLAERALAREWNVQPLLVREGGTMPVRLGRTGSHFQAYLLRNVGQCQPATSPLVWCTLTGLLCSVWQCQHCISQKQLLCAILFYHCAKLKGRLDCMRFSAAT